MLNFKRKKNLVQLNALFSGYPEASGPTVRLSISHQEPRFCFFKPKFWINYEQTADEKPTSHTASPQRWCPSRRWRRLHAAHRRCHEGIEPASKGFPAGVTDICGLLQTGLTPPACSHSPVCTSQCRFSHSVLYLSPYSIQKLSVPPSLR